MTSPTHVAHTLLLILPLFHKFGQTSGLPCSDVLCNSCCIPFSSGCRAAYTTELSGVLVTDNINCKDCPCDHPVIGCGWIGKDFEKLQCNNCKSLRIEIGKY